MGTKVNPRAHRLATIQPPDAKWFSRGERFRQFLKDDVLVRAYLLKKLREASVDRIEIERTNQNLNIIIHTAKPGIVIGRAGSGAEDLKKQMKKMFFRGRRVNITLNVQEVIKPTSSSAIVAEQVAMEIEKRMPFRRSMKQAIERVMKGGALGVKVKLGGRLNGAEIARTEALSAGTIPLQTLRADIDFARSTARTMYGAIGIKVWVYRGDIFEEKQKKSEDQNNV